MKAVTATPFSSTPSRWSLDDLLKGPDDLRAFLELPRPVNGGAIDTGPVLAAEAALGDSGIVMIDTADPLCLAASLFDMSIRCSAGWRARSTDCRWRWSCWRGRPASAPSPSWTWPPRAPWT